MSITFDSLADPDVVGAFALNRKRFKPNFVQSGNVFVLPRHRFVPSAIQSVTGTFALTRPRLVPKFVDGNVFELDRPRMAFYGSTYVPPVLNSFMLPLHLPAFAGVGVVGISGTFALPRKRFAPNFRQSGNAFILNRRRFVPSAYDFGADGGFFFALLSPGYISMQAGSEMQALESTLALGDAALQNIVYALTSVLAFDDTSADLVSVLMQLNSKLDLVDRLKPIVTMLVHSGFTLTDVPTGKMQIVMQLIDALRIAAGVGYTAQVLQAVASAITLHSVATILQRGNLTSALDISTSMSETLAATVQSISNMEFSDATSFKMRIVAVVEDGFEFAATPALTLQALCELQDGLDLAATIQFADTVFYAWVLNTRNKGATQYKNWAFNSMCEFEGRYFGCQSDGLYEQTGDDDAGTDITWSFRTGLMDFGTGKFKRVPALYLGYTAQGAAVLKVVTTIIDGPNEGKREENWYQLDAQPADTMRDGRIKIGKGLESIYWDSTLTGIKPFSLDIARFQPIVIDRRIRNK